MPEMSWGQMKQAASEQGFEPFPVGGPYRVRVDQSEVVDGKVNKQIRVRFRCTEGPNANRTILNRLVPFKNDGDVNGLFFQQIGALGFPQDHPVWQQMEQLGFEQGLNFLAENLMNRECLIDVEHNTQSGRVYDNVSRMRPAAASSGPMIPGGPVVSPGGIPTPPVSTPMPPPVPQAPAMAPVAPAMPAPQPAPVGSFPSGVTTETVAAPGVPGIPQPPNPVTDLDPPF